MNSHCDYIHKLYIFSCHKINNAMTWHTSIRSPLDDMVKINKKSFPRLSKSFPQLSKSFPRLKKSFPRLNKSFPRHSKSFPRHCKLSPRLSYVVPMTY